MNDLEQQRQEYIRHSGLGEAIVGPVRVGDCEVSLHRQVGPDLTWSLIEQEQNQDGLSEWFVISDEPDDDPQGESSTQTFSSLRSEWPEPLREEMGDRPPPMLQPPAIGSVSAMSVCPDGSISQGGPVKTSLGASSWESGSAIHGVLPPGAVSVELTAGEEGVPIHVGQGLFLAAVPPGVGVTLIFRGPQGEVLGELHVEAEWLS